MFLGHYGVALAAKKAAPRVSLGTLAMAGVFLDLLWPVLLVAGVEHVRIAPGITRVTPLDFYDYPISHSLLTVLGWGVAFAVVYFLARRNPRGAMVLAAAVASHWFLDLLVHRPDLPLWPGGRLAGFGLWNSVMATLVAEFGIFVLGLLLYARSTSARDRIGRYGLAALGLVLVAVYAANLLGPPPPNVQVLQWSAFGQWLFVAWMYWVDQHRVMVNGR